MTTENHKAYQDAVQRKNELNAKLSVARSEYYRLDTAYGAAEREANRLGKILLEEVGKTN